MKLQIKKVYEVNGVEFSDVKAAKKAAAQIALVAILGQQLADKLVKENRLAELASACNAIRTKKVMKKKVVATAAKVKA